MNDVGVNESPRRERPASPEHIDQVRSLVESRGEVGAAQALHVSRYTLGRLLGSLPLREATRVLIEQRLGALDGADHAA